MARNAYVLTAVVRLPTEPFDQSGKTIKVAEAEIQMQQQIQAMVRQMIASGASQISHSTLPLGTQILITVSGVTEE